MKRQIYFTTELLDKCDWHLNNGERKCFTPFGEVIEDQSGELWLLMGNGARNEKLHVIEENGSLLVGAPRSRVYSSLLPKVEYDTFLDEVVDWIKIYKYLIFFVYVAAWAVELLSVSRLVSAAISFLAILVAVHMEMGGKSLSSFIKSCAFASFIYIAILFVITFIFGVLFITLAGMGIIYISEATEFLVGDRSILDFFNR
ncbi:hypothetical protein CK498_22700 [Halomonas salipaludis]|uniref:Uncharacterized protein n=2 Tax=Halomonas salipaludis TaxID=2032625 RepID=A0A2A2EPR8_9GAMM|nr:hypothetical protein CK498_22700 [Halomonas salipaludis]